MAERRSAAEEPLEPGAAAEAPARPARLRLILGGSLFALGVLAPAFVPLVALSSLPVAWKTAISGSLIIGGPELLMVAAAAVLGRRGFAWMSGHAKRILARLLHRYGPPATVSRRRYRIGLVLFFAPLVLALLTPFVADLVPGYEAWRMHYALASNLLLVVGLFVLGGEFWEKLRALFVHGACALPPPKAVDAGPGGRGGGEGFDGERAKPG